MAERNGPQSVSQPEGPRRADAVRNRARLIDAARRLVADRGLAEVSMDELAGAAEVGKGTVYRAFGDKAGLAQALLDDAERELQAQILDGPPPLGPGPDASPGDRILAFVEAYLDLVERSRALLLVVDAGRPTARYESGAYDGWLLHLTTQLNRADPDRDTTSVAHAVLALVDPGLMEHLRVGLGYSPERVATTVLDCVRRLVAP